MMEQQQDGQRKERMMWGRDAKCTKPAHIHKNACKQIRTVSLVSRVPAGRDFLHFFLTKESRYSISRHTIVTALPPSVRRNI